MKTKTTVRIIVNADRIAFGYWDAEKGDEGEFVEPKDADGVAEVAKKLDCSPALIQALMLSATITADAVGGDLRDIWRRLDAIEATATPPE